MYLTTGDYVFLRMNGQAQYIICMSYIKFLLTSLSVHHNSNSSYVVDNFTVLRKVNIIETIVATVPEN